MKCSVLGKSRMGAVLCAGMLTAIALSTLGCPATDNIVIFDDPNLERAVRDALGQPLGFLTREGLLDLQTLDAKNLDIQDLAGIKYCENLFWLDLQGNDISNLTELANLTNLMSLNLDSNDISDISPLAGLLNLNSLSLYDNPISDIQALVTNASVGGLGAGDAVYLDAEPLSDQAANVDVPFLESKGVNVVLFVSAAKK